MRLTLKFREFWLGTRIGLRGHNSIFHRCFLRDQFRARALLTPLYF
jgi:hypothetical protein